MSVSAKNESGVLGGVQAAAKRRLSVTFSPDWKALLLRWAAMERGRFLLWAPLLLATGILGYFSLRTEPSAAVPFGGLLVSFVGIGVAHWRRLEFLRGVFLAFAIATAGFSLAMIRTHHVDATMIPREIGPIWVEGAVLSVEQRAAGARYVIAPNKIGGLTTETLPPRVRVSWRGQGEAVRPGDKVAIRAVLSPPPAPALPGGYDYGRQLFFERIGGVGYALGAPRIMARDDQQTLNQWLMEKRLGLAQRISAAGGAQSGPVLAALATGLRGGIDPAITDQLRDTGLAHLLAISGLHMGLVCGTVFFAIRFALSLHARWAGRFPIKKWAAITALIAGAGYLELSGAAWSAQRAFIMAAVSFTAILFDRQAISLRNVAFAALIILCLRPEAILSAGFQMSFAAVTALIAAYDLVRQYPSIRERGLFWTPAKFVGGLSMTSLVAGLATGPFAIFHFHRMAVFGLVANLAAMPLFTALVMPLIVAGLALSPFGLDEPVWWLAGRAFDGILWVTAHIAAWPGAVKVVPQWSLLAFGIAVGGLFAASICFAPWRFGFLMLAAMAPLVGARTDQPIVFIAEDAGNVGIKIVSPSEDALPVVIASRRRERFAMEKWLEGQGYDRPLRDIDKFGECGADICYATAVNGTKIAYTEELEAAARACRDADIVIARLWREEALRPSCAAMLFTSQSLLATGAITIYAKQGKFTIRGVNNIRGKRPWTD